MPKKPIVALDMPKSEEALTERQQKYLDVCDEKLGFVPNVLQAYAWHSTKFDGFTALYNDLMLGDSGLSKLEREMIAVVVSSANSCYYCLTAHGAAVRQLSGNPILGEQMVMNYRTAELEPKIRAREIWDISAVVAFFNMSNRMSAATDKQPNDEYHSMAR